ncbi:hypothetical protein PR202_gb26939 [Eleusine coracana subsp. coracana]|uniref:aldehyde oxygenase (deformylating) n=1 Tax=Eleusine coracana subsp. coracana TaxID=191504 RepID=A0AAV5FSW0_ELECO|nr:hypothetical protein PR202_gb26939 [Eleusine coracana subsp. coracana]
MIPYATAAAAESALGRALTWGEAAWFRYTATTPDYCLYFHSLINLLLAYTLAPVPAALLELCLPAKLTSPYKLQPRVRLSPAAFLRCYRDTARVLVLLTVGPLLFLPYPAIKMAGIRMGLPLPSVGEVAAQLVLYLLVEDYLGYWFHRLLHTEWGYNKFHHVHHEYTAPMGFAAAHSHWIELLILGFPTFAGPAMVPCHMTTFWLWFIIRGVVAIDTHNGFNFPFSASRFIPFYGGAEFHDYHHYVGRQSHSNFAPVFTFCDYIYGTQNVRNYYYITTAYYIAYRCYKATLAKDPR